MRSANGESNAVLPWHVIRQDGDGSRYRVGSYSTRAEALETAERLGDKEGGSTGGYLVERMDGGSGAQA